VAVQLAYRVAMASKSIALGTGVLIGTGWVLWRLTRRKVQLLLGNLSFAEGPRWHAGRLYFSDFYTHEVVSVDMKGKRETVAQVPDPERLPGTHEGEFVSGGPSGLGFGPDGSILIVEMRGRRLLKLSPGCKEPTEVASLKKYMDRQANDMCVDEIGNAYIGNFGFDLKAFMAMPDAEKITCLPNLEKTHLVRVAPDGAAAPCTPKEVCFPNGSVITPDGKTLIVAETFGFGLSAYPRLEDGSLGDKYQWAPLPGIFSDGICLDAEGMVWVAAFMIPGNPVFGRARTIASLLLTGACGAFIRVQQGGAVKDVIPCSGTFKAIACVLGGDDGRTLFMLEAKKTDAKDIEYMLRKGTLMSNSQIRTTSVNVGAARSTTCERYCAGYC